MKYSEIVQESYSDMAGSINMLGQEVQLCEHMEEIDGQYYATTFALNVTDRQILKKAGARFGTLSDGTAAIYFTEGMIKASQPLRNSDEYTQKMMERMVSSLASANAQTYRHAV